MADAVYDVVIIGGGTKTLPAAMYLAKYGGLEVAIFERRHEMGGALASSEAAAPGFTGDPHCTVLNDWYYLPIEQDFPDFEEKGGKLVFYKTPVGVITREDQKCCVLYNEIDDPTREKSAQTITRFAGEKDAETYLKLREYASRPESFYRDAHLSTTFNLPPPPGEQTAGEKWWVDFLKQPDCPVDEEWLIFPPYKAAPQLFQSTGLCFLWLRLAQQAGIQLVEPEAAPQFLHYVLYPPARCMAAGSTHSIAHAYIRIFLENGGQFFTHSHVDKIIIENGRAKGIHLSDGTEIGARNLVLSGVDLHQLCFQLIGREHLSQRIIQLSQRGEVKSKCSEYVGQLESH